nr:hypothetical protein [Hymenobacter perfusus]
MVQQKQGRVQATRQLKGAVPVNDDAGLEKEADKMGERADFLPSQLRSKPRPVLASPSNQTAVVQGAFWPQGAFKWRDDETKKVYDQDQIQVDNRIRVSGFGETFYIESINGRWNRVGVMEQEYILSESDQEEEDEEVDPVAQYYPASFAVAVKATDIDYSNHNSFVKQKIVSVQIPDSRPEGTSGEKEGGHLTAWVVMRSEVAQKVRATMTMPAAIAGMKELAATYFSLPGNSRGQYLDLKQQQIYKQTHDALRKLVGQADHIPPMAWLSYLQKLIEAYLMARNALPLTAVATTENIGKGEAAVNSRLWDFEKDQSIHKDATTENAQEYTSTLLWGVFDATSAHAWASAQDKSEGNFQAMSPRRDEEEEKAPFDANDPVNWLSYERRMLEAIAQHVVTVSQAYPAAYQAAKLTSNAGVKQLIKWTEDPKKMKKLIGVKPKKEAVEGEAIDINEATIVKRLPIVLERIKTGHYVRPDDAIEEEER